MSGPMSLKVKKYKIKHNLGISCSLHIPNKSNSSSSLSFRSSSPALIFWVSEFTNFRQPVSNFAVDSALTMGGHGGLNILPQKRWNVYNFDNREKVRKDEEAAAKEAQIQREEARKRDAQSRLEVLRNVRGLAPLKRPSPEAEKGKDSAPAPAPASPPKTAAVKIAEPEEPKTGHINLFEGIKIFDPIELPKKDDKPADEEDHRRKKMRKEAAATARASAKDAAARAGDPDEEKYRLGYGVAGKGVKLPWYVENKRKYEDRVGGRGEEDGGLRSESKKKSGKKSLKELREERLKRERVEKERERALFMKQSQRSGGFSRR
ncbi:unnamed protein product [Eruca vesicaria subsp. sativa]|uniref:CBF1-interacting co-repressor CIR N-terminal domain-containing protein n=1 Tax=Eruca vesicaria subsp. sativa TaxID=29727 RepID=A0ABC8MAP8_ERUVS|nr:unnamed protein product [Eruca vesicaria subsp. sativa]